MCHLVEGELAQGLDLTLLNLVSGDLAACCLFNHFVAAYVIIMAVGYERQFQRIRVETHPPDILQYNGNAVASTGVYERKPVVTVHQVHVAVSRSRVAVRRSSNQICPIRDLQINPQNISLETCNIN